MAAFNAGRFIDACATGLASQTFTDFEVVVVDDGSTDDTLDRLRTWAGRDGRVRVHAQPNGGGYHARLAGIAKARGAHVAFIDPDDRIEPTFLGDLHDAAVRTAADIVVAGYDRIDLETGRRISVEMTSWGEAVLAVEPTDARLLSINTSLWNKLFRSTVLADPWCLAHAPSLGDDMLIFLRALIASDRVAFVPTVEYHYAVRAGSIVQTFSTDKIDSLGDSLVSAKQQLSSGRGTAFSELIDAVAFLHLGLSASYRLIRNGQPGAGAVIRSSLRVLDAHFPAWRHTHLLSPNPRYRLMRVVARAGLLPLALTALSLLLRLLRRDLSW